MALIMFKCVGHRLVTSFYIWLVLITLSISSIFTRPLISYVIFAILLIYKRNIQFFFDFTQTIYKGYKYGKLRNIQNNYITRILVTDFFNRYFRLINNFSNIPKKPTIFLSNYVKDRVENLACMMLPVDICPMLASWLKYLQNFITPIIIRGKSGQYDIMKDKIKEMHDKGFYIFVYIEQQFSSINDDQVGKLRNGVFNIAKELDIDVTPIAFDRVLYSKNYILKKQNYQICVGDTFKVDDIKESKYKTRRFLRDRIRYFNKTKFNNCY
jgi:hypothetical protein